MSVLSKKEQSKCVIFLFKTCRLSTVYKAESSPEQLRTVIRSWKGEGGAFISSIEMVMCGYCSNIKVSENLVGLKQLNRVEACSCHRHAWPTISPISWVFIKTKLCIILSFFKKQSLRTAQGRSKLDQGAT